MAHKNTKMIWEVIEECSKLKQRVDKIDYLLQNKSDALMSVLKGTHDLSLTFDFGEDEPSPGRDSYTPCEPHNAPSNLLKTHVTLLRFVNHKNNSKFIKNKLKRQSMFIAMLESVHPKDADILLDMLEKKPLGKGITTKVVMEAFPTLISDPKLTTQEKRKWVAEKEAAEKASEEFRSMR